MVIVVALLYAYDGKPMPQWPLGVNHVTITLNALVSLLATLSKAFMLVPLAESIGQLKWLWFEHKSRPLADLQSHDAASRGIRGAVGFVFNIRKM